MSELMRAMLNDILPPGAIWEPEEGKDFDLLLDGIADNAEAVRTFLAALADIRRPSRTVILSDLEKEFGIIENTNLTDADRRTQLAAVKFSKGGNGSKDFLEDSLQAAGFDVFVYANDPAVDPGGLLDAEEYSVAGHENKLAADLASEDWPLVFFVAGTATFGGGGEITDFEYGYVNFDSIPVFNRLLKNIIPMHAWAGQRIIGFKTNYFGFDEDPDANTFGDDTDPDLGGFFSEIV